MLADRWRAVHTVRMGPLARALVLALAIGGCTAPGVTSAPSAPAEAVLTPIPRAEIIESTIVPSPSPRAPRLETPAVTVVRNEFPVTSPSGTLVPGRAGELTDANVRMGLTHYLAGLDNYRLTGNAVTVYLTGAFRDAVISSLDATKRPDVGRKFELTSYRIERVWVKPWGTQALVDVMATITDTVVAGNASPEVETGLLRLAGDRHLQVIDGWTGSGWFNGYPALSRSQLLTELDHTFGWYLGQETWLPGTPVQTFYGPGGETPYSRARNAMLQGLDRQAIAARTLEGVTATVERFETLTDIGDGIATVRLQGTVLTKDAAGIETRTPFTRVIRAFRKSFATGPGDFSVVDELGSDGRWLAGGDIALKTIDQSFG